MIDVDRVNPHEPVLTGRFSARPPVVQIWGGAVPERFFHFANRGFGTDGRAPPEHFRVSTFASTADSFESTSGEPGPVDPGDPLKVAYQGILDLSDRCNWRMRSAWLSASSGADHASATFVYMTDTVGVRELRQNLSRYLDRVKDGERLVVTERNRPVAMLGPVAEEEDPLERLIAAGLVRPPTRSSHDLPPPMKLPGDPYAGSKALDEVRGDR